MTLYLKVKTLYALGELINNKYITINIMKYTNEQLALVMAIERTKQLEKDTNTAYNTKEVLDKADMYLEWLNIKSINKNITND